MALKDVTSYIKNMGKSVGYSMIDVSKETAPAMAEFVDTNKELFKDVYAAVKDHKKFMEKTKALITGSKVYEAADVGLKAMKEDIRTGNFYNKARTAEFEAKYSGFNMDDMDADDIEFSMKDDDDGSFGSVEISDGDKYVGSTVESAVKASADLTSTTIARSAEYMGSVTKASTSAIIVQNERLFGNLSNRIVAMHGGINDLYKLHATAIEATGKMNKEFYENTTNLMRESNAMLKEMLEMQRNMYKQEQQKAKEKTTYGDIVGSNGMPDLKEYAKVIGKNFKGATGQFGDMLGMFGKDSNMLAMMVASPLMFIPNFIAKAVIPAAVASNMSELDKSLSGVFGTSIARFNKMAKKDNSPIGSFIGKLFGISSNVKGSIDTGNYNKGAVPFDGITRKSIIEVIPGHLRRIEAILSGMGDERIYDYDKGKWTSASKLKSQYDSIADQHRNSAFSDLRNHAKRYTKTAGFSKSQKKKFDDDFELFLKQVYEEGGYLPSNLRKMKKEDYNYNISDMNFELIRNILTTMNKGDVMSIAGNVLEARNRHNKTISDLELSGSALYNYLFDGSDMKNSYKKFKNKDGKITGFDTAVNIATVTDNLGNNIFFYLQNMLKTMEWYKLNWGMGGGSSNSRKFRNIKDSDWDSYVNHSSSSNSRKYEDERAYDEKIRKSVANGTYVNFIDADSDEDMAEAQAMLRGKAVLAGIKDEDDRRKEYRSKHYGAFYKEQDDLDMGRYSHGKHNKGIVTRLREAGTLMDKFNVISEGIKDFAKSPATLLASVIDKANQSIFSFFYQDPLYDEDGNKIKGFMDLMTSKMKTSFDKFNKFLDDKILDPLKKKLGVDSFGDLADKFLGMFGLDKKGRKEKWDNLFGEGTFFGDFKKGFKDEIDRITKEVAESTKAAMKATYGKAGEAIFGTNSTSNPVVDKKRQAELARQDLLNRSSARARAYLTGTGYDGEDFEARVAELAGSSKNMRIVRAWEDENAARENEYGNLFNSGDTLDSWINSGSIKDQNAKRNMMAYYASRGQEASEYTKNGNVLDYINMIDKALRTPKKVRRANRFVNESNSQVARATGRESETDSEGDPRQRGIHAFGARMVTKAGLTMISPGEAIIPANMNPFNPDMDTVDINQQLANEKRLKNKFIGSLRDRIATKAGGDDGTGVPLAESKSLAQQAGGKIKDGATELVTRIVLGSDKEAKAFKDATSEITQKIKGYLPTMAATGLIGGGVGLLTGIGGPILGAVAGAGLGLLQKSDTLQNWLFGEVIGEDENGKDIRKGGVISQKMQQSMQKYLPDLKNFGIAGALTGLFTPLGPVGGLMVGSALAYVKNNDKFAQILYGDVIGKDENGKDIRDGGILGKSHMDKLKKAAPNILGGAAIGALAGPFGLVGNLALGSAIGLASSTEGFKTLIFGEEVDGERTGGIAGALHDGFVEPMKEFGKSIKDGFDSFIKDDILSPLAGAIEPLTKEISDMIKGIVMFVPNIFTKFMENRITAPLANWMEERIFNPLGKATKFLLSAPIKLAKTVVSAPFKAVGALGNAVRGKHIAKGKAGYMTARERLDFRAKHKVGMALSIHRDKYREEDEVIANLDASSVQKLKDVLDAQLTGGKSLTQNIEKTKNKIYVAVDKYFKDNDKVLLLNKGTRSKILKAIQKENYKEAVTLIRTGKGKDGRPIPESEREALLEELVPLIETYENLKARKKQLDDLGEVDTVALAREMGFKKFKGTKKDLKKYSDLLRGTYNAFEAEGAYKTDTLGLNDSEDTEIVSNQSLETQTDRIVESIDNLTAMIKGLIDPDSITAVSEEHGDTYESNLASFSEAIANGKAEDLRAARARVTDLAKIYGLHGGLYGDDGEVKHDILSGLINNEAGFDALMRAKNDGTNLRVGNIGKYLYTSQTDNKNFLRLQELGNYTDLPEDMIDAVLKLNKSQYDRLFTAVSRGAKVVDANGKFDKDAFDVLINSDGNYNWETNTGKAYKGKVNEMAHYTVKSVRAIKNAFAGSINKTFDHFFIQFQGLGLVGSGPGAICSEKQLQWLYKNAYYELDRAASAKDPEQAFIELYNKYKNKLPSTATILSAGESVVDASEIETRAFGKFKNLITNNKFVAKFKKIGTSDSSDSKESQEEANKNALENERQNVIASGVTTVAEAIHNWRAKYDKDQKDEESGNNGFWGKLLKGLVLGGRVLGTIGIGAFGAGIYKNYLEPQVANIFNDHVKPWWTDKALPALKESAFGKAIMRGMDYITGSGEFAETGGLRGTLAKGFDWFLGNGEYNGNGLIDKAKGFIMDTIVPNMFTGLEWVIGDLAPKILSGLFTALPKLLGATVRGIGNFFKLSITSLLKPNVKTYAADDFDISYDGNMPTSSVISKGGNSSVLSRWGLAKPATYDFNGTVSTSGVSSSDSGSISGTEYYVNESGRSTAAAVGEAVTRGTLTKGGGLIKAFAKGGLGNKVLKNTVGKLGIAGKAVSGAVGGGSTLLTKITSGGNSLLRKALDKFGVNPDKWLGNAAGEVTEEAAESAVKQGAEAAAKQTAETVGEKVMKETAENVTEKAATGAGKGIVEKVTKFVTEKLTGLFANGTVISAIKKALKASGKEATEKAAKKAAKELGENIIKKLVKNLAEKAAKAAAKAVAKLSASIASAGIVTIAFIVADFVSGMKNAETILGVTDGVSVLERLLCGVINAITENLTFGLIPADTIVDIVVEYAAPALGIDTSKITARREAAIKEIEEWNKEHPDDQYESVESYNKKDRWTTKAWKSVKGWFGGGSDKEDEKRLKASSSTSSYAASASGTSSRVRAAGMYGTGSGKHLSQIDPRYANMRFNSSADSARQTIGDSGCGPVAAAQVVQRYSGYGADPVNAARYAIKNGYKETNGGTYPAFFRDYLGANNINTELLTDIRSTVNRIGSGSPVILMGKDSSNSKSTPYGASPHYVVATGFDKRGNIIIQNPESMTPDSIYNAGDVLSKSSLAIGTSYGTGNGYNKLMGMPMFGRGRAAMTTNMVYDGGSGTGTTSDYIGKHVKKFESGSTGSLTFAKSSGNDWGLSCGTYQFTLRWGNAIKFLTTYFPNIVNQPGYYVVFHNKKDFPSKTWPGATYCSGPAQVEKVWRACYNSVGADAFFKYEWDHAKNNWYKGACNLLSDIFNPNTHSRSMQECIWSWAIHSGVGGCNSDFRAAIAAAGITDPQKASEAKLLKACYDYRYNKYKFKRYSTDSGQERDVVSSLIGKKPIDYSGRSLGTSTAGISTNDEKNALLNENASTSSGINGIFSEIENIVKGTKLYELYNGLFNGSTTSEDATEATSGTGSNRKINSAIRGIIKGSSGMGTTTATANLNKSVSGYKLNTSSINTPSVSIKRTTATNNSTNSLDYSMILTAMIEILSTIANNTAAIQKIVDLLSNSLGIDTSSINTKTDSTGKIKAKLRSKLQELGGGSSGSGTNNPDTLALVNAMAAIARG